MIASILKGILQLVVVGLPSWLLLLFTLDAALVPGADVFIIALGQVVFLLVFIIWFRWRVIGRGDPDIAADADPTTTD